MDAKKREIRNLECQLEYREATQDETEKGFLGTVSGRAICFNAESQILDEYGQKFREIIAPSACSYEFLLTQDVKINMLHVRDLTFGRWKRGQSGNARLFVDEQGVGFEVSIPNCDLGIRARELVKAGVYDGCSFEFLPDEYEIEEREGNVPLVRHTKFRYVTALTLGMDPAYLQTTLHARELWADTATAKREAEEAEAKKKAEEERMRREAEQHERELQREREKSAALRRIRERDMETLEF